MIQMRSGPDAGKEFHEMLEVCRKLRKRVKCRRTEVSEPDRRKMRGMLVVEMNYLRRASLDKMRVRIATGG